MSDQSIKALWESTPLGGGNADYLDALYDAYLTDPNSVPAHWQTYFSKLPSVDDKHQDVSHHAIQQQFLDLVKHPRYYKTGGTVNLDHERKENKVSALINAYRTFGHELAQLDPLKLQETNVVPELDYTFYGLSDRDLDTEFDTGGLNGLNRAPLRQIIEKLKTIYCKDIGFEIMHVFNSKEREWLLKRIEAQDIAATITDESRIRILKKLIAAEGLERYLHVKFVGQKRFSLEGGESLIPLMDDLVQRAGAQGVQEISIGMAHRGRLNVLVNILGKLPKDLFEEFEGKRRDMSLSSGDVKYHQGFSSDIQTAAGVTHLSLAFNPSHLEIVSPVVEGSVRARQVRREDIHHNHIIPFIIHGDAAFSGQGVVMETFSMSQARGFNTGGSIHLVINNQIGFTTSNPQDARSTPYCTDPAKMVLAPIFHVNADDVEAVIFITRLALEYRMTFNKDVVIDLVCYRRHGHNEADEPSATQPIMYKEIKQHATTRSLYAEQLITKKIITAEEDKAFYEAYRTKLDKGQAVVDELLQNDVNVYAVDWTPYIGQSWDEKVDTTFPKERLSVLAKKLFILPDDFTLQAQVGKVMKDRNKMTQGDLPIDWGYAENLAYATLLDQGYSIRLTGQDSGRGTFAHRHAIVYDQKTGEAYLPLAHLKEQQPEILIIDSLLSEEAVLAFEYGYATTDPETLVIWEAQFGDFANGAQVVIDQFISSGEAKWGRLCGLALFLPHGYEGMGPEHSSARLERFLQLCAEQNIQVCVPTTPAQTFHMIRRQMIRPYRKPLVVMTPKSLLRHKMAVSTLDDLATGEFYPVLDEIDAIDRKKVTRVILCSGKVYYDLLTKRREDKREDVAIIRVEQLYPFPEALLTDYLKRYPKAKEIIWCQEEPQNQGAWYCSQHHLYNCLSKDQKLRYVGRKSAASPAVGYTGLHIEQQKALVEEAFA